MGLIAARDEVTAQQGKKDEEISEMHDNLYAAPPSNVDPLVVHVIL